MKNRSSDAKGKCAYCNKTGSQAVCYSKQSIEHRRCSECGEVSVFGFVAKEGNDSARKKEWMLLDYTEIMKRKMTDLLSKYLTHSDYTDGDYLDHPQFGNGYVLQILPPRKMKVLFDGQLKLLMCGAGSPRERDAAANSSRRRKQK